jgi:cbb3-type cytochrome oxidase maturation protein
MESIYLLIPLSIVLVGVAIWAFFWAMNRGQFDNLEDSAGLALEEDNATPAASESPTRRS